MQQSLTQRDKDVIAARQKLRFFPITICSGSGSTVQDESGRQYLDLSASWGAHALGYGNDRIVAAIADAARRSAAASILSTINPDAVELAEALIDAVPVSDNQPRRVLFGHSGTDANTAAIEAITAATGRGIFVAFEGSYHGGSGPAKTVSGMYDGTVGGPGSNTILLPFPASSDPAGSLATMDGLQQVLSRGGVAAVFVEAHQSDGGMIVPPPGFINQVIDMAHRYGALVVCDEVKIGLGRTGKFHGFDHDGAVPDMVTFGKALGGGLPLSAVVGPAAVLDTDPASSLQTTAGGSLATASGLATVRTIREEGFVARSAALGTKFTELLMAAKHDAELGQAFTDIRGRGLSIGVELVDPAAPSDNRQAAVFSHRVVYRMWQLGAVCFLVRGNVIELTPPLIITETEVERAVDIVCNAVADVIAGAVTEREIAPYQGW